MWKNTGAGEFLDKFIAANGKGIYLVGFCFYSLDANNILDRLMQKLDESSGGKHTNNWGCDVVESDKCYGPDNCLNYATVNKPMYIVQTALSWFHDFLKVWHEKLQDTGIITTLSILDIVTAFPNPHKELLDEELAKTTKLFADLGAILGILSTVVGLIPGSGSAMGAGIVGISGAVVGIIGDNIEEDDDDLTQTAQAILSGRLQSAFSVFQEGLEIMARQVFATGDISNWTAAIHDTAATGRTSDLAAFLDGGRYLYSFDFANVETNLKSALTMNLVGTQLTTSGYYILRGAHPTSICGGIISGTVIEDICYTIEFAALGVKEYLWTGERHETTLFSKPITSENLKKITDTWAMALSDIYTSSYNCQGATQVYNGDAEFSTNIPTSGSVPDCFYSLPVLKVKTDDGKQDAIQSTPCYFWDAEYTTDEEKAAHIGEWLPEGLAATFTKSFCVGNCYDIICTLGAPGRVASSDDGNNTTLSIDESDSL